MSHYDLAIDIIKTDMRVLKTIKPMSDHNIERAKIVLESLQLAKKQEKTGIVMITCQGGVLHEVKGLPRGYEYRLIDWDEKDEYPEEFCIQCKEQMCPVRAEDIYFCPTCKVAKPLPPEEDP